METPIVKALTKEEFYDQARAEGKLFAQIEKEWLASGFAIKRGKSAKDNIVHAYLAGEVSQANLKEWLAKNGTENDVKQASYYKNRLEDFELVAKAARSRKAS